MNVDWEEFRKGFRLGLVIFGPPAISAVLIFLAWAFFLGYLR